MTHHLSSADIHVFSPGIILLCQDIIPLTFTDSSKVALVIVTVILTMLTKLVDPGVFKMKLFLNNKILSRYSNSIADVVMSPMFANSSISMITSNL